MENIEASLQPETSDKGGQSTLSLFLALYLLILAFFILLVSISTLEKTKAKAAMSSVTSTFSNILPPSVEITAFSTEEGAILAGQAFQEQITNILATTIQVAKIEVVQPGRLMRVILPTEALFFPSTIKIRPGRLPFIDRIVAALSGRPPGVRYDMEFIIGSTLKKGKQFPTSQTLEMSRGGVFIRELKKRGAPPDSLAMGLMPGSPDKIIIRFYVRSSDEKKLEFPTPGNKAGKRH